MTTISVMRRESVGFEVYIDDARCLFIDANEVSWRGPVCLLESTPEILYSLSSTAVVHRIIAEGPQNLLAKRETAHKLFEHGMKFSWGKVQIGKSTFFASVESFYNVQAQFQRFNHQQDCLTVWTGDKAVTVGYGATFDCDLSSVRTQWNYSS